MAPFYVIASMRAVSAQAADELAVCESPFPSRTPIPARSSSPPCPFSFLLSSAILPSLPLALALARSLSLTPVFTACREHAEKHEPGTLQYQPVRDMQDPLKFKVFEQYAGPEAVAGEYGDEAVGRGQWAVGDGRSGGSRQRRRGEEGSSGGGGCGQKGRGLLGVLADVNAEGRRMGMERRGQRPEDRTPRDAVGRSGVTRA